MEKTDRRLQKECDRQNLGGIFECAAPGTLQQNVVVERKILTLMGRARAMLIQEGINAKENENFGVRSFPQQQIWII